MKMQDPVEQLLLDTAIQNKDIIIQENKVMAKVSFLKLWPYNPKTVEDKDLERLKKQILELKVYKPLVVVLGNNFGYVLGGNQRLKVLADLSRENPEYEYVWISLVEAPKMEDKLKYALSDNDVIGKYSREKIGEIMPEIVGQEALFNDYNLELYGTQTLDKIKEDIFLTEQELKVKNLKSQLLEAGLNIETAEAISQESSYHKNLHKIPDVEIKGEQVKERYMIAFWADSIDDYNYLTAMFGTSRKFNNDTNKLLAFCKAKLKEFMETYEKESQTIQG